MEMSEREKIDELLELERDNNRILRKMRRGMAWGQFFTFLYWLLILGGVGAAYFYLEPPGTKYSNVYQSAVKTLENVQKTANSYTIGK